MIRWFRRKPLERTDFEKRYDEACKIERWSDRMDALIELIKEDPTRYAECVRKEYR